MSPVIFVAVLVSINVRIQASQSIQKTTKGPLTLCPPNVFESECPPNEVVMFQSALYMESNLCYDDSNNDPNTTGFGNCSLDVTSELERSCLGKWGCSVDLEEPLKKWKEDYGKMECLKREDAWQASIVLTYDCIPVEKSACLSCENSDFAKLTQARGYLASIVTLDSRISTICGNSKCPWYLRVPPGQVVNVTVIDSDQHHAGHSSSSSSFSSSDSTSCHRKYVTVKERSNPKDVYYCGGRGRINHLYTSVGNVVEVHINDERLSNVGGQFLVYYEVIGCADIIPPRFSRMKRFGDTCEIDCPDSDLKWTLTCKDQNWEGLEAVGECPPSPGLLEAEPQKSNEGGGAGIFSTTLFGMPTGVVMSLVVASAVILGVLILTTGLVCLKRNQYDAKHRDDPNVYGAACSEFEFREMGMGQMHPSLLPKSAPYMNTGAFIAGRSRRTSADLLSGNPRDNTYAMQDMVKMDARPLPSLPNNMQNVQRAGCNSWRRNDGPVPYGVVRFYPPGVVDQSNRVTVQLHRTDIGTAERMGGAAHRARFPVPCGQYSTGFTGRFDPRSMKRMPGPYNDDHNQEENHYFVLDGKACTEEATDQTEQQTMMMMAATGAAPFPRPPPAHQNKPLVTTTNTTTVPRSIPSAGNNGMMMMMAALPDHRHQLSYGGGDLGCTCDDRTAVCHVPPRPEFDPRIPGTPDAVQARVN